MSAGASLFLFALLAGGSSPLKIEHDPIACMVKDRYPLVEAAIEPAANVAKAQVCFRAALAESYHSVPMTLAMGRFRATLPKPKEKAGTVVYYIEAIDATGATQRTPEMSAQVVKKKEACAEGGLVAAEGPDVEVRVYATAASPRKPDEFSGIAAVTVVHPATEAAPTAASLAVTPSPTPPPSEGPSAPQQPPATTAPGSEGKPAPSGVMPGQEDFEYQIGPNDILKIAVFGYDDMTQTVLVQPDGTFMYPLIGRVKASDMAPKELERKLIVLLGKGYIRNPQVTVTVQEARSRSVYVLGEVGRAGSYSLVEAKTVLDLAARAGISNTADVMIVRPRGNVQGPILPAEAEAVDGEAQKKAEIIRVSMRDIQAGDLGQNLPLRPNDTIFVIAGKRVYVLGEVRSPGGFAPPVGATVEQMILLAGGFSDRASKGNIRIAREVEGKKKELKAKLDDAVLPGDIITIKAKLF